MRLDHVHRARDAVAKTHKLCCDTYRFRRNIGFIESDDDDTNRSREAAQGKLGDIVVTRYDDAPIREGGFHDLVVCAVDREHVSLRHNIKSVSAQRCCQSRRHTRIKEKAHPYLASARPS